MALVDTSILIRYLINDRVEIAEAVRAFIDDTESLVLSEVVIAEAAYVLMSNYGVPREAVVDGLVGLLRRGNIETLSTPTELVVDALALCRPSGRVSFADALVWAAARAAGRDTVVYSLDRRFPSAEIDLRYPA